jgi:N-methylhydantoinase A
VSFQIGIDVGGTFTDFVVGRADSTDDGFYLTKTPSTAGDEASAIITGLAEAAAHYDQRLDAFLRATEVIVLGTTVVTNALLQYTGARVGVVTTAGFRDMLDLRRNYRESLFDIRLQPPHPIAPRHRRLGVRERIDWRGTIEIPLDEEGGAAAARRLRELEVESVAICFLFSFVNPCHELRMRELVAAELLDVPVTLSCEILPQIREFERLSTTILNAYTRPLAERSLRSLQDGLRRAGFGGELFVMQSNGGMIHDDYARRHSIELALSGPAGGVVAGARLSTLSGYASVITLDMGGTSCDVCLVKDGEPASGTDAWISRYRVATPMVDVHTIGAGGGSIAWIDDGGALRVGPQSAGATPGPACYGNGGAEPTVTDANVVLGYVNPDGFLGGRMRLDADAARAAIEERVARPLNLDVVEAASGISRIANHSMANAVRHVTVARGRDPREFALCVFGGAGAIHAGAIAPELGIRTILVPKAASVLSAVGNQLSDFKIVKVQSFIRRVVDLELDDVNEAFGVLLERAHQDLGVQEKVRETVIRRYLAMRYKGQTREVLVPIRSRTRRVTAINLKSALQEFHAIHEELYSFNQPEHPTEVVDLRLELTGVRDALRIRSEPLGDEDATAARTGTRAVYFYGHGFVDTPVYAGPRIAPGQLVQGPAVIEEPTTTLVVYPDQEAMADQYRTYVVELQA